MPPNPEQDPSLVINPEMQLPQLGGCWIREPSGELVPDPAEPPPPGLPPETQPE